MSHLVDEARLVRGLFSVEDAKRMELLEAKVFEAEARHNEAVWSDADRAFLDTVRSRMALVSREWQSCQDLLERQHRAKVELDRAIAREIKP